MKFDENMSFADMAIKGFGLDSPPKKTETEPIAEYLLGQLDIEYQKIDDDEKMLLQKNFIYVICRVLQDIREISDHIKEYETRLKDIENDKSNAAEYKRRKLKYFCKINLDAEKEIIDFLNSGIKEYLLEKKFDCLLREENSDGLSMAFMDTRYSYAYLKQYYDIDFDFSTVVKISRLPDVKMDFLKVERKYMDLLKRDPDEYWKQLKKIVNSQKIMQRVEVIASGNYHLNKRKDIFHDLCWLFEEKRYQSFVSLGLLQLEGLFYDYCLLKYGEKDNSGTLVEKVSKTFQGRNDFNFARYYPYFAFDVPIERNEIAHTGMLNADDIENAAYGLVLDLNEVIYEVKGESFNKFFPFAIIHEDMLKYESEESDYNPTSKEEIYKKFVEELITNSVVADDHFWKVLKNPQDFTDELEFYTPETLQDGYIDLLGIVTILSLMVREEAFWKELLDVVKQYCNGKERHNPLRDVAYRLKNDYIGELDGEQKKYCIEISKILNEIT